jgi:hypothetical protein
MGSSPARSMDVRLRLFCVCVADCLRIKKLSETKRFTDVLWFKVGATEMR